MAKTLVFPCTADPFHRGHVEVIRRSVDPYVRGGSRLTDFPEKVVVLILKDDHKQPLLPVKDRELIVRGLLADLSVPVEVEVSECSLLSDALLRRGGDLSDVTILKGARTPDEMTAEQRATEIHIKALRGLVRAEYVMTSGNLPEVSSSYIRERAYHHVDVTNDTSVLAQSRLWRALHQQKVIGVVGSSRKLWAAFKEAMANACTPWRNHYLDNGLGRATEIQDILREDLAFRESLKSLAGLVFVPVSDPNLFHRVNNNVLVLGEDWSRVVEHDTGSIYVAGGIGMLHLSREEDAPLMALTIQGLVRGGGF